MSDDPKHTILVVDDTETNIDILVEALGDRYDISVAMDGPTALEDCSQDPPDLILLDITMPEMDGYEVCQRLKEDGDTRDIPVIFLSALSNTDDKVRGLSLGAVDYVTKPFDVKELMARVQRQIELLNERRRLTDENQRLMGQTSHSAMPAAERSKWLTSLIQTGEHEGLEFKSTLRWSLTEDRVHPGVEKAWLKTVVAFLNTEGGILLVGVDDDGSLVGYERDQFENEDKYLLHVNNRIQQNIGLEHAHCIRYSMEPVEETKVLVIECTPSSHPVFLRQGKEESFFIRVGPGSRKLTTSQALTYVMERQRGTKTV